MTELILFYNIQVLVEIPYIFVQTVVYGVIVYSMIGFEWTAAKFFWYIFFMFVTLLYYTFFGMMTVAVAPNPSIASIVSGLFFGLWNLFAGFIVPRTVSSFFILQLIKIHILNMQHTIMTLIQVRTIFL